MNDNDNDNIPALESNAPAIDSGIKPLTEKKSPLWTNTTKLIVGIALLAISAWVFIRFQNILGPLLMVGVIDYLLYPIANRLHKKLKISWRFAVNLIFLVFILILVGLLTWGSLALADQASSLVRFMQRSIADLPGFLDRITSQPLVIGPFTIDLPTLGLENLVTQLFGLIQPLMSNVGTIVGSIAGGAASTIGWIFFIILVSYFILLESRSPLGKMLNFHIPGYSYDLQRMSFELSRVWNSFLRGQLIIVIITMVIYTALLGGLGVRYFYALAILAGIARFVPYLGAWITWVTYFLVTIFQGSNIFGLQPIFYALLVVGISLIIDSLIDNLLNTRVMANSLRVHPAAVMVTVLIAASLFGIIGILLAAPVLATVKLLINYILRKMFDIDPWEGIPTNTGQVQSFKNIFPWMNKVAKYFKTLKLKIQRKGKVTNERPK
ncbi:MAG: AI-2E family transporter [Anaerolineaceae bacterium]